MGRDENYVQGGEFMVFGIKGKQLIKLDDEGTLMGDDTYYVYTLSKPTGDIFYVGKGKGNRIDDHEREARRSKRKTRKLSTIRKIWREGGEVVKEKVAFFASEDEAYEFEAWLIGALIDAGKPLTNIAPGGRVGIPPTPETIEKIRNSKLGHVVSLDTREKLRQAITGKPGTPHTEEEKKAVGERFSKDWAGFVSPSGVEYRCIHNLKAFCRVHDLNANLMGQVAKGTRNHHKGWTSLQQNG